MQLAARSRHQYPARTGGVEAAARLDPGNRELFILMVGQRDDMRVAGAPHRLSAELHHQRPRSQKIARQRRDRSVACRGQEQKTDNIRHQHEPSTCPCPFHALPPFSLADRRTTFKPSIILFVFKHHFQINAIKTARIDKSTLDKPFSHHL
ncbi:MAG: hypothetical protein ACREQX_13210 [Candidatus Binataceae bacterium]